MRSLASPDLSPTDFSVWSMLKAKVSYVDHLSVDTLKTSLRRQWAKIPKETLRASVGNFIQRIKLLIEKK